MAKESALHRRARVKLQLRDKHGRWIEMGGGVKWLSSKLGKEISGTVVGSDGQNALVDLNDDKGHPTKGTPIAVPAHQLEVVDSKATLDAPAAPSEATPPHAPDAGIPSPKDDPDHDATMAKYGSTDQQYTVTHTPDGHTYFSVPEGTDMYTPARELAVGDEVIAPDGAHPQKPFSIGRSWATKDAERVNTQGPKIGKVISIKENAYAVVQLPEGEMVESTQHPGEMVNTVTIGLSNRVIKATPELKASLKDVIPEPTYADLNAPSAPDTNAPEAPAAPHAPEDHGTPATPEAPAHADAAPVQDQHAPEAAPEAHAPAEATPALEAPSEAPQEQVAAPAEDTAPKAPATAASDIEKGLAELEQASEDVSSANLQGDEASEVLDSSSFKFTGPDGSQNTVTASQDENGDWNFVVSDENGAEKSSHIVGSEDNHALAEKLATGDAPKDATPASPHDSAQAPSAPETYNENGLTPEEQQQVDGAMRLASRSYQQFKDDEGDRYKAMADELLAKGAERNKSASPSEAPAQAENAPAIGPSDEEKIANAEKMYGTGSPQHKQAQERFGKSDSTEATPVQKDEKAPENAPQPEQAPEATHEPEKAPEAAPAPNLIEPDKAPEKPSEEPAEKAPETPPTQFGFSIERQRSGLEQAVASHPELMTPEETQEFNKLNSDLAWAQHDNRRGLESTTRGKLADLERSIKTRMDQEAMSRYRDDTSDSSHDSVEKSTESASAPSTESAPSEGTQPATPEVNEDGLLPNEAARLSDLETRLGNAYNPNNPSTEDVEPLEREINELLAHGEARQKGENVGEFKASQPVPDHAPESSEPTSAATPQAPSESAPEAKSTPEAAPEQAPATPEANAPQATPEAPAAPAAPRTRSQNSSGNPVADADGNMISRGDQIGHPSLGPVEITNTIPSSGRIEFTDPATGRTRSVRAANVRRIDPNAAPAPETDSSSVVKTPGERFVDAASGKKGFGDKNGARVLVGDKVVDRNGNVGEVKGVYGGADGLASVPVQFQDGTIRRVKGSQLSKHDESATPSAKETPEAATKPAEEKAPAPEQPSTPQAPATPARTPEASAIIRQERIRHLESLPNGATVSSMNGEHKFTKTGEDQWTSISDPGAILNNEDVVGIVMRGNDRGLTYSVNRNGGSSAPQTPTAPEVPSAGSPIPENTPMPEHVRDRLDVLNNAPAGTTLHSPSGAVFTKNANGRWAEEGTTNDWGSSTVALLTRNSGGAWSLNSSSVPKPEGTNVSSLGVMDRLRALRAADVGSKLTGVDGKVYTKSDRRMWKDEAGKLYDPADMVRITGEGRYGLTGPEATSSEPVVHNGTVLPSDQASREAMLKLSPNGAAIKRTESGSTFVKIDTDLWRNERDGTEFDSRGLSLISSAGEWKLHSQGLPDENARPIPQELESRQRIAEDAPIGTQVVSTMGLRYRKISDTEWADAATGMYKYGTAEFASMLRNNQYSGDWSVIGFDVPDIVPQAPSLASEDFDERTGYVGSLPVGTIISHENGREFKKIGREVWVDNNGMEWGDQSIAQIAGRQGGEGWTVTPAQVPQAPTDVIHDKLPVGTFLPSAEGSKSGMKRVGPDQWEMIKDGQPTGRIVSDDTVKIFQELMGTTPAAPVNDERLGADVGMSAVDLQLPGGKTLGEYLEQGGSYGSLTSTQKQAIRNGYDKFIANLNTKLPDGFRAEMQGTIHFGQDSMTTYVQFYQGDRPLGAAERRFSSTTDSRTGKRVSSVEHAFWALRDDVQGAGLSSAFLKASKQMYRQMGLNRITVHADISVGSYAWARGGFDFRSPTYMSSAIASWEANFPRVAPRGREAEWAAAKQKFAELKARATYDNFMNGTHPAAIEFANIGRPEGNAGPDVSWFGKEMLMNTHWYGDFMLNSDAPSATVAPSQ